MAIPHAPKEVTLTLLLACSRRINNQPGLSDDKRKASLLRSSHLRLNGRGLQRLSHLDMCPNARVLYAFDNLIEDLLPACDAKLLESVYAQNNLISTVPSDFGKLLPNLTRLYLNGNKISMFSGWAGVESSVLAELHLADQQDCTDGLSFDSDTLVSLSGSLKVLDISGNKLHSLSFLNGLTSLETLLADHNELNDTEDVIAFISQNTSLKVLSLLGNPVCASSSILRDGAVLLCPQLEFFNGKSVSEAERQFVQRKSKSNAVLQSMLDNVTY